MRVRFRFRLQKKLHLDQKEYRFQIGLCAAIGTGVQRLVQRAGGFFAFFDQLYELGQLVERGIINKETYQEIVNELVKRRFLNKALVSALVSYRT